MAVHNRPSRSKHQFKSGPADGVVYWWQLNFKPGGKVSKKKADSFRLSQHVLNLRKTLKPINRPGAPAANSQTPAAYRSTGPAIDSTNFLSPGPTTFWQPAGWLRYKYPWLDELSIFLILELLIALVYWPVRVVARFYYWLYRHLSGVWKGMLQDVVYYFEINYKIFRFILPWNWFGSHRPNVYFAVPGRRQLGLLILIASLLILPLKWAGFSADLSRQKGRFISYAEAALGQFSLASQALLDGNFSDAARGFDEVSKIMAQADTELQKISSRLGAVVGLPGPQQQLAAATLLLQAGKNISDSGSIISAALSSLENAPNTSVSEVDLSLKMLLLQRALAETSPKIVAAVTQMDKALEYSLPDDLRQEIAQLSSVLVGLQAALRQVSDLPNVLSQIIPASGERRYLLVFQNYSELRPSGGFLGSLAIVETSDGKISKITIPGGGPYDWEGQLAVKVAPPEPLRLVNSLWQLQDANWFFDFPTSAQKIAWFIKQSGGPDFDGVIAVNPDLVLALLKILGPIDLPEYGKHLTSENFIRETQEAVELEYDRETNKPKQFIADLAPILISRVFNLKVPNQIEVLSLVEQALQRKSIQIYFSDPELEQRIVAAGWAGEVKDVSGDYLAIVRANIGGGKTDLVISEAVQHTATLLPTGDLVDKVEFSRTHQGDPFDIFYSRRNVSWLKFFVPAGSVLIESSGFETMPADYFRPIHEQASLDADLFAHEQITDSGATAGMQVARESGKTVFAGWLTLEPGQSKTVSLVYRLPLKLNRTSKLQDVREYQAYLAKQSGVDDITLTSTIALPVGWRIRWQEGTSKLQLVPDGIQLISNWQEDESYGVLIEAPSSLLTNQ